MFESLPKKIRIDKYVVSDKGDGMVLPLAREATREERGGTGAVKTFKAGDVVVCLSNSFYAKRNTEIAPNEEKPDDFFELLNVKAEFMLLNKHIFQKVEL